MNLAPIKFEGLAENEQHTAEELIDALNDVVGGVERAAKLWIQLGEDAQARFIEASPVGVRYLWGRLTMIGEKRLVPGLYSAEGRAAKAMARLPFRSQEKLMRDHVPVIIDNKLEIVDPTALTSEQTAQVFDTSRRSVHVRDVKEQQRYLAARRREAAKLEKASVEKMETFKIDRKGKWKIRNGKARIMPALNKSGIGLTEALTLVRDLKNVRRVTR